MIKNLSLRVSPEIAYSNSSLSEYVSAQLAIPKEQITGIRRTRQSIDARGKQVVFQIEVEVFLSPTLKGEIQIQRFKPAPFRAGGEPVIIVGAGPAGIFDAL